MDLPQAQELLKRQTEAIATVRRLLDNKDLWFELRAVALELNDADDLREAISTKEGSLRAQRLRPGWVPLPDPEPWQPLRKPRSLKPTALLWNGDIFQYDNGQTIRPLLQCSREARTRSCGHIPALLEKLRARP